MPQPSTFHRNIRHYCKNLLWLVIMMPLVLSITNIAGAAAPSPEEIYQTMMQKEIPSLEQFQLDLNAKWMGESAFTAIVGWSGGLAITASGSSPMVPGGVTVQAALRPSGFSYFKAGNLEEVSAGLVPYVDEWLDILPRIINKEMLLKLTDIYDIEYAGETEISGRQVYILDLTLSPDLFIEQLKNIYITIAQEPVVAMALYQEGVYVEEVVARWDELTLELKTELSAQAAVKERIFVDQLDYRMLGFDMSALQELLEADLQENYPDAVAMNFSVFRYELDEIKVDADGHITELSWLFHLAAPVLPQKADTDTQDEVAKSPDDQLAFSLDMGFTETVVGGQLLPTYIGADITIDPLLLQYNPSGLDLNLAERKNFHCSLEMKWDLEKGADSNLLENKKLLNAEKYWNKGLEAYKVGDYKTATKQLAQLTHIVPTFVYARSLLSDAYFATGETMAAISELEQVLMLQPYDIHALNNLAYQYVDYDIDLERGLELAEEAYEMASYDPSIVDTLAWAYLKNEMLLEATQAMSEVLQLCEMEKCSVEDMSIYHYHMGVIYAAQELWAEAAQQLELAVQMDAEYSEAADLLKEVRLKQVSQSK